MIKNNRNKLFLLLLCCYACVYSQRAPQDDWYNRAITYFDKNEFIKADSLFSLSTERYPNGDNYFYRAKCRGKNANKTGYCHDLAYACFYENFEAVTLFLKTCGKIDTVNKTINSQSNAYNIKERTVSYLCSDSSLNLFKKQRLLSQIYSKTVIDSIKRFDSINNFSTIKEQASEYPGGIREMGMFIAKNLKLPKKFNSDMNGKVYLKFIIYEDGSIQNIAIVKGISNCEECNHEAQRVVVIMPKWKPAVMNGKRVKCYFNLPISFRV